MATHNERSSYTANVLALRRVHTSIPFSQEIAEVMEREGYVNNAEREDASQRVGMTPFFEARYRMTDRILKEHRMRQVVELAAGLSPRGIHMTGEPDVMYVEVDLFSESLLKRMVIGQLIKEGTIPPRPNIRFSAGNVTDPSLFERFRPELRREPVAFVCEGLLRYLSLQDKEILGKCIHDILEDLGGIWITPDIEFNGPGCISPARAAHFEQLAATGMDVRPNLFRDMMHAITFFRDLGFGMQCFPLIEIAHELVSPSRLGLAPEQISDAFVNSMTFVMTAE